MRVAALSLAFAFAAAQPVWAQPVLLAPPPPPGVGFSPSLAFDDPAARTPQANDDAPGPDEQGEDGAEDIFLLDEIAPDPEDADATLAAEEAERDTLLVEEDEAADPVDSAEAEAEAGEPVDLATPQGQPLAPPGDDAITRTALSASRAGATAAAIAPAGLADPDATLLTLTVERDVRAAPDQATITIGVVTEGQTAQAASIANAQAMTALMRALRAAQIEAGDVQTSQLRLEPQRRYEPGSDPGITGYQAVNTVAVLVRDLTALGPTLDAAAASGANQIEGVSFGFSDPEPILNQARRDAVRSARERAGLYAEAAGMRLQRIVAIQEGFAMAPPVPMPRVAMAETAAATPISPGETTLTAAVTMTFALQ